MIELDWRLLTAIALLSLWLFHRLTSAWGAWRRSLRARRRGARAVQGEHDAEQLLEVAGFEIVERQLRKLWSLECDGEIRQFDLRADLLVAKDGQQYIAEVKTGERAPDLANAATRRQLLEYALAYQSPTILLVDVEGEAIHEVVFPLPSDALSTGTLPPPSAEPETETAPTLEESAGQAVA